MFLSRTAVIQLHLALSNHPILYADFSKMLPSCRSLVTLCVYDDFVSEWPTDLQLLLSISAPDLEGLTIAPIVLGDLTKLRRETSKAPQFPALKSLSLTPARTNTMGSRTVSSANACLPGIKLLILNYTKFSFIGSLKTTDSRPLWPELDGLAVRDICDQGVSYKSVQDRQGFGLPGSLPPRRHKLGLAASIK